MLHRKTNEGKNMDYTAKNYIISENKDFALVNKPVGMDSEHAMGDGFFPIHRLDKVASGLLLYAKNPISAKKLSEACLLYTSPSPRD